MDAVDDLGDAIDVTRDLLWPVQFGLWIKLAIVVLFVAGVGLGGGVPTADVGPLLEDPEFDVDPVDDPAVDDPALEEPPESVGDLIGELPEEALVVAAVVLVALLLLWLLFAVIGAIMEFVFVESLRSKEVRILRFGRENLGRGLQLFLFRFVVGLVAVGIGAALFATVGLGIVGDLSPGIAAFLLVVAGVALYAPYAIVMRFTSEFVAPVMLLEERGIFSGWKRFWGTLTSNLGEYAVYLVLVWILQIVVSIAITFLLAILGLVVAIPFVILLVLLVVLGEVGVLLAIPVVALGVLAFLLLGAFVQMPFRSYFQYYALLLLGDTNTDLDLIPEQREAARDSADEPAESVDREADSSAPDGRWGRDDRDDAEPDESSLWDEATERDGEDGDDSEDATDDDRGW
ncbi:DUF7544 domain-containing protein [Natronobacterium gregoryi]|uniref:Uncharacterized protein n=2 Tax=Natronobacterium gregoryi TaxID=44930 RepID=L0AKV6_NATGS|nr:DUF4013 domain-containing protein [Natronobacterium gregoryi]AFZ74441.1 hypothetical protein Natgr_3316 [Natronobacterium gregoryi SP2]ELY72098.1 hypothetical protein C490_04062 [Natronobacterium gregoryi SP2]PLK19771.1 hypothetical protein CYV19_13270 [Natronobacterium gregoryi SP2]SFJ41024.1 hypothetical protein SAMN05443661_12742 [Natronobacterium gregoryi]